MYNIHKLKQIFRALLEEGREVDPKIESERYRIHVATAVEALEELVEENIAKRASTFLVIRRHDVRQLHTYRYKGKVPPLTPLASEVPDSVANL